MLSVTPILLQLKRSAGKQGMGRGFGCPALPVPWPASDRDMSPALGHVPPWGAQANPFQAGHGWGTLVGKVNWSEGQQRDLAGS